MKIFLGVIAGIAALIGLTWIIQGNEFFFYKYWAPKQEAVRRQVFEQTKSYNQGMVQELDQFYRDYTKGGKEEKAAIKALVLHRVADFPSENLPPYLQSWVTELRNPNTNSFKEISK